MTADQLNAHLGVGVPAGWRPVDMGDARVWVPADVTVETEGGATLCGDSGQPPLPVHGLLGIGFATRCVRVTRGSCRDKPARSCRRRLSRSVRRTEPSTGTACVPRRRPAVERLRRTPTRGAACAPRQPYRTNPRHPRAVVAEGCARVRAAARSGRLPHRELLRSLGVDPEAVGRHQARRVLLRLLLAHITEG